MTDSGYIEVFVDGERYRAHLLAWYFVYGEWTQVDHKDRIKYNNTILNLRKATQQQNMANQEVRSTNLLGVKGVQKRGKKFRSYITSNYQTYHIGTFDTIEEAIEARQRAARSLFGEFSCE